MICILFKLLYLYCSVNTTITLIHISYDMFIKSVVTLIT